MIEFNFWITSAVIVALWVLFRAVIALKNHTISFKREAQLLLVLVCIVVVFRVVMFPLHHVDGHVGTLKYDPDKIFPIWYNLVPIYHLFDIYDGWQINIIGNILLFVPVGIIWPFCFKKLNSVGKTVLAGAGFTLLIEIIQLPLFGRCSDIDDMILNTTGVLIGALIYFFHKCP